MTRNELEAAAPEDLALLQGLRAGSEQAFDQVVRAHAGSMLAAARRLLGDEQEARLAVQDAFALAFKSLDRFDGQTPFAVLLCRLVIGAALSRLSARSRQPERVLEELLPRFHENGRHASTAASWPELAARVTQQDEARSCMRAAIAQLPETYRTVLLLRDVEGFSADEASLALELNAALVKTRLHRARQVLRGALEAHFRQGAPC